MGIYFGFDELGDLRNDLGIEVLSLLEFNTKEEVFLVK